MTSFYKVLVATCMVITGLQAHAVDMTLEHLSDADMDKVVGDISANFMHTTVSGANTLGHIFGFEVGLMGGQGNTPNLEQVVHQNHPDLKADKMPHGGLIGVLSVPLGLTAEASMIPKVGTEDFKFANMGLAAKWTPTELFLDWPFSAAIRLSQTATRLDFKKTISGVDTTYKMTNSVTTLAAVVSKNFILVEPYFGIGVASAKGDLDATGSSTVFDSGVTGKGKKAGTVWMVGAELKLLIVKVGAEYTNALGASRYTGKLSFYF